MDWLCVCCAGELTGRADSGVARVCSPLLRVSKPPVESTAGCSGVLDSALDAPCSHPNNQGL